MQIFGLKLFFLSLGLLMVYTGLFNWPEKKASLPMGDYNIIDAEWEEVTDGQKHKKLDVLV
jgi:hypothetical protein|tara:strand:- start:9207 stop:9389 length:183 start_codon:yes stop_codon:yes gene_type:complete